MSRPSVRLASLFCIMALAVGAAAHPAAAKECAGTSRILTVGKKPVQINPGGRCNFTFLPRVKRSELRPCFYAKTVGKKETLGPFCASRTKVVGLPWTTEWLWSADVPVPIEIILFPKWRR